MVKKRRKYTRKTKSRMFVIFVFFGIVIITLGYTLFTNLQQISSINKEKVILNKEMDSLNEEKESLEADIARLSDSEYVARYARERYFYSKDGELVLRIDE